MEPTTSLAERILDAAAEIVIGDGVDALGYGTLAESLGIPRADVTAAYPVFERLLADLLTRETADLTQIVVDNVDRDPRGGLPSRIFGYALSAVYEHPLARALYIGDPDGLNRIMRAIDGVTTLPQLSIHPELLGALQAAGTARHDFDATAVTAVITVLGSGVSMSAPGQHLDSVASGLITLLERAVDAEVADTAAGKAAFFRYAETLADTGGPR
ncbi:TetR/AcrR family transcriptional regulator [Protaetiibacter intestinalis]|uniref:TetR/AcrR family transcriptional regulator n=1 Tax=Protaetiibacter intestinalis TaxID=2419774 RepID=A0A387BC64_9MICO|nr:TetR/AcrR family transcriptional regulator [Protaetiibacter intestinalis]AYF98676.1 TetR/AcrR family transcriptional regulator [Protaetiibacter intestinalis]